MAYDRFDLPPSHFRLPGRRPQPSQPFPVRGVLNLLLLVLVLVGLIAFGEMTAAHITRVVAVLACVAVGLRWSAPAVTPGAGGKHRRLSRLIRPVLAVVSALLAWWLVPTAEGQNLWGARLQAQDLVERAQANPAGDYPGFAAAAPERVRLVRLFPQYAGPIHAAERAWLKRTVEKSVADARASEAERPAQALLRLAALEGGLRELPRESAHWMRGYGWRPVEFLPAAAADGEAGRQTVHPSGAFRTLPAGLINEVQEAQRALRERAVELVVAEAVKLRQGDPAGALARAERGLRDLSPFLPEGSGLRERLVAARREAGLALGDRLCADLKALAPGDRAGFARGVPKRHEVQKEFPEHRDRLWRAEVDWVGRTIDTVLADVRPLLAKEPAEVSRRLRALGAEFAAQLTVAQAVRARLEEGRQQAVLARFQLAKQEVKDLVAKERFAAAVDVAERLAADVGAEARAVGASAEIDRFCASCRFIAEVARRAGKDKAK